MNRTRPATTRPATGGLCIAGALAATAFACSVDPVPYTTDADTGSTHALVKIEHSESLDAEPSAHAIAGFAHLPAEVEVDGAMGLVGLGLDIPEPNQCLPRSRDMEELASSVQSGLVEFLEAGDVTLGAEDLRLTLAPRSLPTVPDLVSGVVYTTRDEDAAPLPAAVRYTVDVSGSPSLAALDADAVAPERIDAVTIGGVPLLDVDRISVSEPVDITWAVGSPADLVYIELSSLDGTTPVGCTFRDDTGAGTIPDGLFAGRGEGQLSMRRVRRAELYGEDVNHGELRFELELRANMQFAE